jgi:beta-galactosidase
MLYMLQDGVAERLVNFVQAGGTLVDTYLTGLVDKSDLVFLGGTLGPLKDLLGIEVEETDGPLDHSPQTIRMTDYILRSANYPVKQYADTVHLHGASVLAIYEQDYYAGSPAITVNQFGKGKAYYLAVRGDDRFLLEFHSLLVENLGLERAISHPLPRSVTAQVRKTDTEKFKFLLNFGQAPQIVRMDGLDGRDALSGEILGDEIRLPGFGFRILKQANKV